MNVLFLTQFYWPEVRTAPINLGAMAENLKTKGHKVTVITGFPNHPFGRIYDGYRLRIRQWDNVRGVAVLRLPLFPDHSPSVVRRALNYGSFALSASTLGLLGACQSKPEVIFVYLPPLTVGVPAALLRRLFGAPIVYWITDLWPESLMAAGARIGSRAHHFIRGVENWVYERSEFVCVNSPGFKDNLIDKGVPPDKIRVIMDWADEKLFFPTEPDERLAGEFGLTGKFNIIYGGNLGPVQALSTVVAAAQILEDLDVQFVFIGDGTDEQNLRQQVVQSGLKNVRFIPRQPMEEIHRFFSLADVLLIHLKREPIFEMQVPSKTMAYLACGRPILCAVPGAAASIVQDAGAGVVCPSEDARALAEQVRFLRSRPRSELEVMGRSGRQAYVENYTREIQVSRIEMILKQAAGGNRRPDGAPP